MRERANIPARASPYRSGHYSVTHPSPARNKVAVIQIVLIYEEALVYGDKAKIVPVKVKIVPIKVTVKASNKLALGNEA
jgi:hypothetical protein